MIRLLLPVNNHQLTPTPYIPQKDLYPPTRQTNALDYPFSANEEILCDSLIMAITASKTTTAATTGVVVSVTTTMQVRR
jgi:hypothetical protein